MSEQEEQYTQAVLYADPVGWEGDWPTVTEWTSAPPDPCPARSGAQSEIAQQQVWAILSVVGEGGASTCLCACGELKITL